MRIALIVAVSRNLVIGTETGLPWRLSSDLKRFRALTLGKPILMGRKTQEMIGRPLDGRPNVVLTRKRGHASFPETGKDACPLFVVHSAAEALELCRQRPGADEVMVIGGGEVYREFLPLADRVYLTVVDAVVEGTATFPSELPAGAAWAVTHSERVPADERNQYPHTFHVLERTPAAEAPPVGLLELLHDS
jgi:dihydrofolate reductase